MISDSDDDIPLNLLHQNQKTKLAQSHPGSLTNTPASLSLTNTENDVIKNKNATQSSSTQPIQQPTLPITRVDHTESKHPVNHTENNATHHKAVPLPIIPKEKNINGVGSKLQSIVKKRRTISSSSSSSSESSSTSSSNSSSSSSSSSKSSSSSSTPSSSPSNSKSSSSSPIPPSPQSSLDSNSPLIKHFDRQKKTVIKKEPTQDIRKQTNGVKAPPKSSLKTHPNHTNTPSKKPVSIKTDDEANFKLSSFNPTTRSRKQKLVAQLLCRWWYALPDWPQPSYDYSQDLLEKNLKCVSIEEWEECDDIDENGLIKVYEISAFPGIFRDPKGNTIDLRDKKSCPSYTNFMKLPEIEILKLIQRAITKQLEILKTSPFNEHNYTRSLYKELNDITRQLQNYH